MPFDSRDAVYIPAEDLTPGMKIALYSSVYPDAGWSLDTTLGDILDFLSPPTLDLNVQTVYTGGRVDLTKCAIDVTQTATGSSAGLDWIPLNSFTISSDTLDVNPPVNTIYSFNAQIDVAVLTINSAIVGAPKFTVTASISGTVLTLSAPVTGGTVTAGLTVFWNAGANSGTIQSGGGSGGTTYNLDANYGTVTSQSMTMIGPAPGNLLSWDSGDPDNPNIATIAGYTLTPNHWNLTATAGPVPNMPMQIVKNGGPQQQAIGWNFNHFYGGGNASGNRTSIRLQVTQAGAMPAGTNGTQGMIIGNSARFPFGGTDLWAGAWGGALGFGTYMNMVKPVFTPVGSPGAVNWRGLAACEFDYTCASGAPDDPAYPRASVGAFGGITVNRLGNTQWNTPVWEADFGIAVGQGASYVRDGSGNIVPPKLARFGYRFSAPPGVWPIDMLVGRGMGAAFGLQVFNNDGTPGLYPNKGRHGIDWYNVDWTGTQFRGQGFSIVGSGGPFSIPGAVQVGGGYLSASATTISLDTAGSMCSAAAVSNGGAVLFPGLPLIHDDTGTICIVTAVDNAVRPGFGAATAVFLIANTGRAVQSQIPSNPVTFRAATVWSQRYPAPGPTNPTLTLTWTQPTILALQPGGGTVQVGSGCIAANASVATVLGSVGPVGSHTTVQEWIAIKNASGTTRYIPAF